MDDIDMARPKTITNTKGLHSTNVSQLKQWAREILHKSGPAVDRTTLNEIAQSAQAIDEHLKQKYTNLNTLKTHFATLGKVGKILGSEELYQKYAGEGLSVQLARQERESRGTGLDARELENWVTQNHLKRRIRQLSDREDKKSLMSRLALALNVLQPPLRSDVADMKVVTRLPPANQRNRNYLLVNNDSQEVSYLLYSPVKVSGKENHVGDNPTIPLSPELSAIIRDTLRVFPRKFLLSKSSDPNQSLGTQSYSSLLSKAVPGKRVGINILRSSYATNFYIRNPAPSDRERLAQSMRTSVGELDRSYAKFEQLPPELVDDLDVPSGVTIPSSGTAGGRSSGGRGTTPSCQACSNNDDASFAEDMEEDGREEDDQDPCDNPNPLANPTTLRPVQEYGKRYYQENKERFKINGERYRSRNIDKLRKAKFLSKLNHGEVKCPRQSTLDKWGVSFNEATRTWQ
jgi:hypothetical protein